MKAIAAVSENWGIGKNNDLLFHISADMKSFRAATLDSVVIMGRKTLDSFPGGKPLPKRVNIVITKNPDFCRENVVVAHSPQEAIEKAAQYGKEIFVIGGSSVYEQLLERCQECIITKVAACPPADSFFPDLDALPNWQIAAESPAMEENGISFKFVTYKQR